MEEKDKIDLEETNLEKNEENTTSPNEESLELTIEQDLTNQLAEQKDKFLRLFAEFDNYKKRMAKDRLDYMSTAGKDVVVDMLPILDDFERAMKAFQNSEDLSAIKEGLTLIYDKMNKTFERKGIKKIEAIGNLFDAEKHEAITEIPIGDESKKGYVVDEVESGYTMNDKIVRFSKVVVGK
jgi:molecular chaperone GrpE